MSDHPQALRGLPGRHPNPLVNATIQRIRTHGWAITAIGDQCDCESPDCLPPDCPFAYTTGFGLHSIPELAVYGLDATTSGRILNELGDLLHVFDWRTVVEGRTELPLKSTGGPVRLIELLDKEDLRISNALFPNLAALQVVWPDDHGLYPWDQDYGLPRHEQEIKGVLPTGDGYRQAPQITPHAGPNRAQRRRAARRTARP